MKTKKLKKQYKRHERMIGQLQQDLNACQKQVETLGQTLARSEESLALPDRKSDLLPKSVGSDQKEKAQAVLSIYGMSLEDYLNICLLRLIEDQKIPQGLYPRPKS